MKPLTAAILLATALAATSRPAQAIDAACQRVADATAKRIATKEFHQRQEMPGFVHELLKSGDRLWMRDNGEPWGNAPFTLDEVRTASLQANALLLSCQRTGADSVAGMATEVYRISMKGSDGKPLEARVWIGANDGLPYREESPGLKGTTVYRDIRAPR